MINPLNLGFLKPGKIWDGEGEHPTEVRELGKSKWSEDFGDDDIDQTEGMKGNINALSGLIHQYGKERKSVHWGDQVLYIFTAIIQKLRKYYFEVSFNLVFWFQKLHSCLSSFGKREGKSGGAGIEHQVLYGKDGGMSYQLIGVCFFIIIIFVFIYFLHLLAFEELGALKYRKRELS